MSKQLLTRRQLTRQALIGAAGALLAGALPSVSEAQVVDPRPAVPPPLPGAIPQQNVSPMPISPLPRSPLSISDLTEGALLTQIVPVAAGYTLSETQAKEVALQLKDYPGGFAKARAYTIPDDIGPAFAADDPVRKERVK